MKQPIYYFQVSISDNRVDLSERSDTFDLQSWELLTSIQ